ncbi:MAG TPA: DUF5615 family PIN-like protein [Bryobacteraceae bacterium]|nr:DUF5615 family PIN-like protein [Bryobacteraceae bacterium]
MKFKLDENLGSRTAGLIGEAGHDVQTVSDEKLNGAEDVRLYEVCASEDRCLITLDLDFADVVRFPPRAGAGIAVLRSSGSVSLNIL